jgi:hypothetical protein
MLGLTLAACASTPPPSSGLPMLRLQPAALGNARYALSQRLSVTRLDQPGMPPQRVEAQLQLDATGLLLAGFAFGQRVLLMQWDGSNLQVQRHVALPTQVDTDRMLRDLCLVFWPASAVRAALPEGWAWIDDAAGQVLQQGGKARLVVQRPSTGIVEIVNLAEGYRLRIESQPLEAP